MEWNAQEAIGIVTVLGTVYATWRAVRADDARHVETAQKLGVEADQSVQSMFVAAAGLLREDVRRVQQENGALRTEIDEVRRQGLELERKDHVRELEMMEMRRKVSDVEADNAELARGAEILIKQLVEAKIEPAWKPRRSRRERHDDPKEENP